MRMLQFVKSPLDPCLYTKSVNGHTIYVAIFVDDIIIAGSHESILSSFKTDMKNVYRMKDLGEMESVLGMQIQHDRAGGVLSLAQTKYISDILRRFGFSESNPVSTPLEPGLKLVRGANIAEADAIAGSTSKSMKRGRADKSLDPSHLQYREIVGSLMYLMISTRPDLCYAVSYLARYMNCYNSSHYNAAVHVLKYVAGTRSSGIVYRRNSPLYPVGYADSDWGSDLDTRRSTTGYVFMMAGGPISWKSCLQHTVALSSSEAEYMALSAAAQEAVYLRQLCVSLSIPTTAATTIYEDNSGCIDMSSNPTMNARTKHIDLRYHFTRERCLTGEIDVTKIPTAQNLADMFTKSLPVQVFRSFRDQLVSDIRTVVHSNLGSIFG
jgi:hypothetical protein